MIFFLGIEFLFCKHKLEDEQNNLTSKSFLYNSINATK